MTKRLIRGETGSCGTYGDTATDRQAKIWWVAGKLNLSGPGKMTREIRSEYGPAVGGRTQEKE